MRYNWDMQVLYPTDLRARKAHRARLERQRRRRQWRNKFVTILLLVILTVGIAGSVAYTRPVAAVQPSLVALPQENIAPLDLPWPTTGQAAVGAVGFDVVDEYNTETPKPIASTTKMVTALVVLKAKPLQRGQQGPDITLSANDEAIYHSYISQGGSVYPVTAGEVISQRQAMNALLVMSANNIADLLAVWAYGSMEAYLKAANAYVAENGISHTVISDASGFSPKTTSTAADLVRIGQLIMQDPLLKEVVAQKSLTIPGLGDVPSTNVLLGDGVVGIKTGNTDEAGGCFVIAVTHVVDGEEVTIVAAVMGADTVRTAMARAQRVALDARAGFARHTVVAAGATVAEYHLPWGETVTAMADDSLESVVWLPKLPRPEVSLQQVDANKDGHVGTVSLPDGESVAVVLSQGASSPPLVWRLFGRYV